MHDFRTFIDNVKLQIHLLTPTYNSQRRNKTCTPAAGVLIASCQVTDRLGSPEQMETDEGAPSADR